MYFFKRKGRQVLDLRGDFILSHNPQLVRARVRSAAPTIVRNSRYVVNIPARGFRFKLKATALALAFIWGKSRALDLAVAEV